MSLDSVHLAEILERHNRTCNALVVFLDIEKYSKRRTLSQIEVIDALTEDMEKALDAVSRQHIQYAQQNALNFKTDIIKIPTGDGAAIVFSFDGLHSIHLDFARELLKITAERRSAQPCDHFDVNGWCNCHAYLNLRLGLAEGRVIIYRDLNGNYNVAGSTINLASRVMGLADRNQIIFMTHAYLQIIDMIDDPTFVSCFREFRDVQIKHNEKINVYQYIGRDETFINQQPPEDLMIKKRMFEAMRQMHSSGFPIPDPEVFEQLDKKSMVQLMERFAAAVGQLRIAPTVAKLGGKGPEHTVPQLPGSAPEALSEQTTG